MDHGWLDAFVMPRHRSPLFWDMASWFTNHLFRVVDAMGRVLP